MASLITFANFTPTVATSPIPTSDVSDEPPPAIVQELSIPEFIEFESAKRGVDGKLASAIAYCESRNRQFEDDSNIPLRGIENSYDVGIFQINEHFHLEKSQEMGYNIHSVEGNVDYALWLLEKEGPKHWKASKPCWSKKIANA